MTQEQEGTDDKIDRRERFERNRQRGTTTGAGSDDMPRRLRIAPYRRERFDYTDYLDDDNLEE